MSMAKCKCDKIIDTDFEMGMDAQGNCACDDCDAEMFNVFVNDLQKIGYAENVAENLAEKLMNEGYRKIK